MTTRAVITIATAAAMTATLSVAALAQGTVESITARVNAVKNGSVRMSFAAREGVCGDGNNWIRTGSHTRVGNTTTTFNSSRDVDSACDTGPVRIVVDRADGYTIDIRPYVGGRWRVNADAVDLGTVSAAAAARWLVSVAEGDDAPKAARGAIFGATLADSSTDIWKPLLRIARNDARPREVRSQAVFWVANIAGDKVAASLDSIAYEPGDRDVRQQAIFALSQLPTEESVPKLIHMAQTIKDRDLRKNAIFWLGQSKDPRAVAWFEQVLNSGN